MKAHNSPLISGGTGSDTILGVASRNYIFVSAGKDQLKGRARDDAHTGVAMRECDTIVDFQDFQNGAPTGDVIPLPVTFQAIALEWNLCSGLTHICRPIPGGRYIIHVTGISVANIASDVI